MLRVTDEQRSDPEWAQSRTLPAGDVFRARLILAIDTAKSYSQIEAELGTSRPTLAPWRRRTEEEGLAGLDTRRRHRGSTESRTVGAGPCNPGDIEPSKDDLAEGMVQALRPSKARS